MTAHQPGCDAQHGARQACNTRSDPLKPVPEDTVALVREPAAIRTGMSATSQIYRDAAPGESLLVSALNSAVVELNLGLSGRAYIARNAVELSRRARSAPPPRRRGSAESEGWAATHEDNCQAAGAAVPLRFATPILRRPEFASAVLYNGREGETVEVQQLAGGFVEVRTPLGAGYVRGSAVGLAESEEAANESGDPGVASDADGVEPALFCAGCGVPLADDAAFCHRCGRAAHRRSSERIRASIAGPLTAETAQDWAAQRLRASWQRAHAVDSSPAHGTLAGPGVFGPLLFLLGGAGITASPFLPWVKVDFVLTANASLYDIAKLSGSYSGFTEVLVIGLAAVVGGLLRAVQAINLTAARVWGGICGMLGLIEVVYRYNKLQLLGVVTLQFGFYLLAIGSVAVLAGAIFDRDV